MRCTGTGRVPFGSVHTGAGLIASIVRPATLPVTNTTPRDPTSLGNDSVYAVLEDRQANLWIGTNNGLDRLDRQSGTFIHYQNNPKDATSLSSNHVNCFLEDRQGNLWVGTNGMVGLNRLERGTGKFKRYTN